MPLARRVAAAALSSFASLAVAVVAIGACGTGSPAATPGASDAGADARVDGAVVGDAGPPCDLLHSDTTCPAGSTCVTYTTDAAGHQGTRCVTAGTAKGATACTAGAHPCAPGYDCVFLGGGAATSCARYCRAGHDEDCAGTACVTTTPAIVVDGVTYGYCASGCRLDDATSCGADGHCVELAPTSGAAFTVCLARVGAAASPCAASWDCDPGSFCNGGTCARWCVPSASPSTCPGGAACQATNVSVDGVAYGACP